MTPGQSRRLVTKVWSHEAGFDRPVSTGLFLQAALGQIIDVTVVADAAVRHACEALVCFQSHSKMLATPFSRLHGRDPGCTSMPA